CTILGPGGGARRRRSNRRKTNGRRSTASSIGSAYHTQAENKNMTAKVIRIPERDANSVQSEARADSRAGGWDPFEVWRTRVLLPRLEDSRSEPLPAQRQPGKRSVLKRLRRAKKD